MNVGGLVEPRLEFTEEGEEVCDHAGEISALVREGQVERTHLKVVHESEDRHYVCGCAGARVAAGQWNWDRRRGAA